MMKYSFLSFLLFFSIFCSAQSYRQIHDEAIVTDTHNDIISVTIEDGLKFDSDLRGRTQTDLKRLREGGIDIQVFSVFCDGTQKNPFQYANRQIDSLYAWIARNPDEMMLVTNMDELQEAVKTKKLGCMIGVEGGHMIEGNLANLDSLYKRGARYMTLTWNNNNDIATSAEYESGNQKIKGKVDTISQKKGLTEFGKKVVKRMNELGMMIDLSHTGEQTFWDVLKITDKPVLVSHSNAYAISPNFRNLKDDQIEAVGKNGGTIDLNFYTEFLDSTALARINRVKNLKSAERKKLKAEGLDSGEIEKRVRQKYMKEAVAVRAPFHLLFDHMNRIISLAGIDHVGLGADYDGIGFYNTPEKLTDVSKYPLITKELLRRGFSKEDIFKILGGNFIRVFEANQEHAYRSGQ